MPDVTARGALIGCGGIIAVSLFVLMVIPFTRVLTIGLLTGDSIGDDFRPLGYHVDRLSDPDPDVVHEAIRAIARFHERGAPAIPALLELARDPERGSQLGGKVVRTRLRLSAISAIGGMKEAAAGAVPDLIPFLTHPHRETREVAFGALDRIGPAAFSDPAPVIALLDDPFDGNQVRGILRQHAPEALKAEIRRLLDPKLPVPVRLKGCDLAGDYGPESRDLVAPLKAAMANDPDPEVRKAARAALVALSWDPDAPNP